MGVTERLWNNSSGKSGFIFLLGAFLAYIILSRVHENRRLKKLGGERAHPLNYFLPFGLDFIVRAIQDMLTDRNIENWDYIFRTVPTAPWSPTGEVTVLGQRVIFTSDPENIKAVLATQFADYGKGEPFHRGWREFLGDSIFTTDGAAWHASRQLIRPQFVRDRVSDLECFEEHVQILFRAVRNGGPLCNEEGGDGGDGGAGGPRRGSIGKEENGEDLVVDIAELFFRFTLDVTTDFLLGDDVKSLTTPNNKFARAFDTVQRIQGLATRAQKAHILIPRHEFRAGLRVVNGFLNQYIDRALRLDPEELATKAKSDTDYTFLHALAGFTRDRAVLRDQLIAVLLAGRDTTAGTLSCTLMELARRPQVVRRLRAEILAKLGAERRRPSYEDLKDMPYLKNVISESLRLYPGVPFNMRMALTDTTIPRGGGPDGSRPVSVLKDTPVAYSPLVMQRDPNLYPPPSEDFPDPGIFYPERWENWHPKSHHYIPFNAGPRICVGQPFALTEIAYVLCRMFQKYERVESRMGGLESDTPQLKADITLKPRNGVKVAFWEAKQ